MRSLKEVIAITFAYYNAGRAPQDTIVAMYAEDLADLPEQSCIEAYSTYRRNPKNRTFPLPAVIREIVCPEENITAEAQGREIAARITSAIPKWGYSNVPEARAYIGEIGWRIVERNGGWQYICERHGVDINPSTFQAQIRDQAIAHVQYGSAAIERSIHALPERKNEPVQIGSIVRQLTSNVKTLPSADAEDQKPS